MNRLSAAIVLALCILGISFGAFTALKQRAKLDWPIVQGQIISTGAAPMWDRYLKDRRYSFGPVIEYSYEVNGLTHKNRRIFLEGARNVLARRDLNKESAEKYWQGRFPVGGQLPVYYNRQNPREAYLLQQADVTPLLLMILPLLPVAWCCSILMRPSPKKEQGFWRQLRDARESRKKEWVTINVLLTMSPLFAIWAFGFKAAVIEFVVMLAVLSIYFLVLVFWLKFADWFKDGLEDENVALLKQAGGE